MMRRLLPLAAFFARLRDRWAGHLRLRCESLTQMHRLALVGALPLVMGLVVLYLLLNPSVVRSPTGSQLAPQRHGPVALPSDGPYLHTDGALLRDSQGRRVRLSGLNWFGLETCAFAPQGLDHRSWGDLLDQARALGFNTLRLPVSDQLLDPGSYPRGIDYALNPDLRGLSGLGVLDRIVAGAGRRGLRVLLDRHRPGCGAQSALWYTRRYPQARWIADLVRLARRYRGQPAVLGVDLHNEPHGPATWGDGNPATDWRLAAERAGDAVLRANPHLLIVVQGVESYRGDYYWWGGNLEGAATAPVRLAVPDRLVYEAHDYGPGVYWQGWFSAPDYPRNLPALWRRHWAYLAEEGMAPVLLGEFGGRNVALPHVSKRDTAGATPSGDPATLTRAQVEEGVWQRLLVNYLAQNPAIGFMYWSFTPNSSDTGGLLTDDWQTASGVKMQLLRGVLGAAIPLPHAWPPPAPVRVLASNVMSPGGNQQSLTLRVVNDSSQPLPLAKATLRYWMDASSPVSTTVAASAALAPPDLQREADVDWTSTGANTVVTETGVAYGHAFIALRFVGVAPDLESLGPYGGAVTVIFRLHRADWAPYVPDHDWSYAPSLALVPVPRLTLSVDGRRVWGTNPSAHPSRKATRSHRKRSAAGGS